MAFSRYKTLTCIDNFAKYLGLNVLAFNGAYATECDVPSVGECQEFFHFGTFQSGGKINWNDIALQLQIAEQQVQQFLGYPVSKTCICAEEHPWPEHYTKAYRKWFGSYRTPMKFNLHTKCIIKGGQCTDELLINATDITYSNLNSEENIGLILPFVTYADTFSETATLVATLPVGTVMTSELVNDIFLQYVGTEYTICDLESVTYDDTTREIRIVLNSWYLLNPAMQTSMAHEGNALDACSADNYVTEIDIYLKYVNPCLPEAELVWIGGESGCSNNLDCEEETIPACIRIHDTYSSEVSVVPVEIDDTVSPCTVTPLDYCGYNRPPDKVRFNYLAGCESGCEQLIWPIVLLAASRLPYDLCTCDFFLDRLKRWQDDRSLVNKQRTYMVTPNQLENIFGTRVGELEAYKILSHYSMNKKCCFD